MKAFLIIVCILFTIGQTKSQKWEKYLPQNKAKAKSVNFYDLQNAFTQYWKGKDLKNKYIAKGKGYKPFKRWEEFMKPRVYPTGRFPANQTWLAYQQEKGKRKQKATQVSNWKLLGPETVPLDNSGSITGVGRINCVAFHPTNPNILFAGSPSGGFWKSINGGASWFTTTDELPSIGVSDIAVDPSNPDIIYIATGDGDANDTYSIGVLKSTDGGLSWNNTGLSWTVDNQLVVRRLLVNPNNPNVLIAATSIGIYYTIDAGNNWENVKTGHFKDLEFNPADPQVVYAAKFGSSSRFYKSVNGGADFVEISIGVDLTETKRLELAVSGQTNADVVYALYSERENDGFHSLWKSSDAGETWTQVYDLISGKNLLGWESNGSDEGGQGWYDLSLSVSPTNAEEVYVGGVNIWKTIDSGMDWSLVGHWWGNNAPYVHADHHYLTYSPSGVLFNGNDGGLYKSSDGGVSWTDISDGLEILQIDRIGTSTQTPNIAIVGTQDNGTMKYDASSDTWTQIYGGDGADCFVDRTDDKIIYISYVNGDLLRSMNGGQTYEPIPPPSVGDGAWHTPFIMDPTDNQTLYAGFNDVWKSTDRGDSWVQVSNNLSPDAFLTQLAVAPSDPNYIYATTGEKIWRTKDGGTSWVEIVSQDLVGLYVTYLAIANDNPERFWLTVSGFTQGKKVFATDNAGDDWANVSGSLPNVPINCIVRETQSNDVLYLGTDIGVYYIDASMEDWQAFSAGLPNVVISELEIQYEKNVLLAGTRGRGLWKTPIEITSKTEVLFSECFDGNTLPVDWEVETINDQGGVDAAIDFIVNSEHPVGLVAKSCSGFARFNSFSCEENDKMRLNMNTSISTIDVDSMRLSFYYTQDNENSDRNDTIITQWSVNAVSWKNLDTLTRYSETGDSWKKYAKALPDDAENISNLYIGIVFISASGNDLHIDDIKIEKIIPSPPMFKSAKTNEDGTEIELKFTKKMSDPTGRQTDFSINNGSVITPLSVNLKLGKDSVFILKLPTAISENENVTVSYSEGSVIAQDKGILASFVNKIVENDVNTAIENIGQSGKIKVYPNPNSGVFDIEFKQLNSGGETFVSLVNMSGQIVYKKTFKNMNILSNYKYRLDVTSLPKGVYQLMVEMDRDKMQVKIVLE